MQQFEQLRRAPLGAKARRLGAAVALCAALFATTTKADETVVTLRAVTPYTPEMYLSQPLFIFKDLVESKTEGRVKIEVLGGEEVVPSLQQFDALRNGVVDLIVGVTSYYASAVPEGLALLYVQKLPSELRTNGFHELMEAAHREKGGVVYLAYAGGTPGSAFRLYLRTPVDKPDFTGLKIRVSPVYTALVEGLNGTPVSMPFSDTYTALERGMVDGFGSTYAGIGNYGLPEVSKYVINHPFYSLNETILINADAWAAIPEPIQAELLALAPEFEIAVQDYMADYLKGEDERLKEAGMEFITFSPEDAERYLAVAYDAGWAAFLAANPDTGPAIKALAED